MVSCLGSASIAFPFFDVFRPPTDVSLQDWPSVVDSIKANRDAHPWASRLPRLVFRGGAGRMCSTCATPEGYSAQSLLLQADGHEYCSRNKAISLEHTDTRYDFGVNYPHKLTMPMHEQFKYVLYLHGQCHWASRLRHFLFQGLVLFKQVGQCDEFYGMRLRPWVHYIPVDYNLNNLSASLDWAIANEDRVLKIIKNMHDYAEKFNTARFAIKYAFELLHEYSNLLDYNVTLRPQLDYLPTVDSFEATFNKQIARGRNT